MDLIKEEVLVSKDYKINIDGEVLIIEKLTYPHLIIKMDYTDALLPVESIRVLEEADPTDVQEAVSGIRNYLELMV